MIKDRTMYTVLLPSGRTLVFGNRSIADIYVSAYLGVLIGSPVESESIIDNII